MLCSFVGRKRRRNGFVSQRQGPRLTAPLRARSGSSPQDPCVNITQSQRGALLSAQGTAEMGSFRSGRPVLESAASAGVLASLARGPVLLRCGPICTEFLIAYQRSPRPIRFRTAASVVDLSRDPSRQSFLSLITDLVSRVSATVASELFSGLLGQGITQADTRALGAVLLNKFDAGRLKCFLKAREGLRRSRQPQSRSFNSLDCCQADQ